MNPAHEAQPDNPDPDHFETPFDYPPNPFPRSIILSRMDSVSQSEIVSNGSQTET